MGQCGYVIIVNKNNDTIYQQYCNSFIIDNSL